MPADFDFWTVLRDPQVDALVKVVVAGLVGALIGLEREMDGKPAGIRTYGLVAMGAAIFTTVGIQTFGPGDPGSRVAAQIVTGIGFIGAGTILQMKRRVVGLTTAAGVWVAAAVGMAIGGGLYVLGIGAGVILFLMLQFLHPRVLRPLRARIRRGSPQRVGDQGPDRTLGGWPGQGGLAPQQLRASDRTGTGSRPWLRSRLPAPPASR